MQFLGLSLHELVPDDQLVGDRSHVTLRREVVPAEAAAQMSIVTFHKLGLLIDKTLGVFDYRNEAVPHSW